MPKYIVIYIKGHAAFSNPGIVFREQPGKHRLEIEGASRQEAYINACSHFAGLGLDISVARDAQTNENLLRFTDNDIQMVRDAGAPFLTDIVSGVRIEAIVEAI